MEDQPRNPTENPLSRMVQDDLSELHIFDLDVSKEVIESGIGEKVFKVLTTPPSRPISIREGASYQDCTYTMSIYKSGLWNQKPGPVKVNITMRYPHEDGSSYIIGLTVGTVSADGEVNFKPTEDTQVGNLDFTADQQSVIQSFVLGHVTTYKHKIQERKHAPRAPIRESILFGNTYGTGLIESSVLEDRNTVLVGDDDQVLLTFLKEKKIPYQLFSYHESDPRYEQNKGSGVLVLPDYINPGAIFYPLKNSGHKFEHGWWPDGRPAKTAGLRLKEEYIPD